MQAVYEVISVQQVQNGTEVILAPVDPNLNDPDHDNHKMFDRESIVSNQIRLVLKSGLEEFELGNQVNLILDLAKGV